MNERDVELQLQRLLSSAPIVPAPERLWTAIVRDRALPAPMPASARRRSTGRTVTAFIGLAATLVLAVTLVAIAFHRSTPAASGPGSFTQIGSMTVARSNQVAVSLADGRVLLVGGAGPLASAELYDPATGTFTATGSMTRGRVDPRATLLADGRVLVMGGSSFGVDGSPGDASAELYDPRTGTFSATGSMAVPRQHETATRLSDGRVLVVGGDSANQMLASAELYDPATGTFSSTGSPALGRTMSSAVLLQNGRVLIEGGYGQDGITDTAELYDPATGSFRSAGSMGIGRIWDTATLLPDGRVLIVGGDAAEPGDATIPTSAQLYDPVSGKFTATGSLNYGRHDHTATLLRDGRVLIVGGFQSDPLDSYRPVSETYDPATGKFSPAAPLVFPTANHTATLLPDGRVLIAGGRQATQPNRLAVAELWDPNGTPVATPSESGTDLATPGS
ncbi:MAG TPA: kelch repeat-containing protein [Candidatus Limnocylindrales bacterium]